MSNPNDPSSTPPPVNPPGGTDQPSADQPSAGAPGSGQPASGQPVQNPSGQPGFGQPGFGQPGFGQPGFGQPGFGQPGFGQWQYGAPPMQPPAKSNNAWVKGCAIGCGVLAALSLLALILILVLSVAVGKRVANVVGVLTGPVDASNSYLGAYRAGDNTVDLACSASDNSAIIAKLDDAKGAGSLSRYYLDHSSIVNGTARVTGTVSFSDSDKYARLTLRKHGSEWKVCDIDVSMSTTVESNTTALP